MITACRASSAGDAVNHSLEKVLTDTFSNLYWLVSGLIVHDAVITVVVRVA